MLETKVYGKAIQNDMMVSKLWQLKHFGERCLFKLLKRDNKDIYNVAKDLWKI